MGWEDAASHTIASLGGGSLWLSLWLAGRQTTEYLRQKTLTRVC